ncbi:MAG: hypothetical protein Q9217_006209 [Psora testacea]
MPTVHLPTDRSKWLAQATNFGPDFAGGDFMPSGSQFSLKHFLRLRILHRQGGKGPSPSGDIRKLPTDHADCFPQRLLEEVRTVLDGDSDIKSLETYLPDRRAIYNWKQKRFVPSGRFAAGLDLLCLIVAREEEIDASSGEDDVSVPKVFSPYNTRSRAKEDSPDITSPLARLSFKTGALPQTPTPKGRFSLIEDENVTSVQDSPDSYVSPPNTELRRIESDYERSLLVTGDEQTVNACLINFLIPVTHILGSMGRIHFDRVSFQVLRANNEPLYQACVDGVIKTTGGKLQGFLEVKRYLRVDERGVRMQEAAQMAAYIYKNSKDESSGKTGKKKKWLISMGAFQAFITIATYSQKYVQFLSNGIPESAPQDEQTFMTMEEYGPFDLRSYDDGLGLFLLYAGVLIRNDDR